MKNQDGGISTEKSLELEALQICDLIDKLERVEEEKDKNTCSVIHNGERIMVGESYDCVMERMGRAIKEANR